MIKKMKVLVTGGGFIGGHMIDALLARSCDVTVLDRRAPRRDVARADVEFLLGDIRDRDLVADAVAHHDGVINLAGILGTAETVDNPYPSVATNIVGALNVLEACRPSSARPSGVRGVQITVGNHFMQNTYAITKSTAERFTLMYNEEHGTRVAVVRVLNAYGERQQPSPVRKMVPNFVIAALRGEPLQVYGDGEQIMDMIYVGDVADILVRALLVDHGCYDRVFESGTGRHTTVNDIASLINAHAGNAAGCVHLPMRAGEPARAVVVGDPQSLRPLGAYPEDLLTLENGLERTVSWYRDHYPWEAVSEDGAVSGSRARSGTPRRVA